MPAPESLLRLLSGVIDYAGLFPPAKLDMPMTVRNYHMYLASDDAWMLGRLIVPVARLDEFEASAEGLLPGLEEDDPWLISAITVPAADESLERDLDRIDLFNAKHADPAAGLAMIDTIELRATDMASIDRATELIPDTLMPYFEVPVDRDPRGLIAALAGTESGAKVRTGGIEPSLFPTPPQLAAFLMACHHAEIPFKATAGLHHPLRHASRTVAGAQEFGFLNVFIGAALVLANRLDASTLAELLDDGDRAHFTITDEELGWRDHLLDVEQVVTARMHFAASYGSCSFTEPLDDLRALDLY